MRYPEPMSGGLPDHDRFLEFNDCHEPAGSPEGGQFCSKGAGGSSSGSGHPMKVTKSAADYERQRHPMKVTSNKPHPMKVTKSADDYERQRTGHPMKVTSNKSPSPHYTSDQWNSMGVEDVARSELKRVFGSDFGWGGATGIDGMVRRALRKSKTREEAKRKILNLPIFRGK